MIVLKYNSILKLSQSSMISEHLLCDENFTTCFIYKIYFSFIVNQDHDYFLICENIIQKYLAKLQKSDHNQKYI